MRLSNFQLWRSFAKEAMDASMLIVKLVCLLQVTRTHVFNFALVYGPSMLPTISLSGDIVLVDCISPRIGKMGRGDIVIVRSPENPRKVVTKRLAGIEGDHMTFAVDPQSDSGECKTVVVPKGYVWVQGDNVYDSRDSRTFGAVPYGLLQGRVFWRVFPLKDFGAL
ncbi:hypothetical protein Dimus_031009 [Dionaea muscipula]